MRKTGCCTIENYVEGLSVDLDLQPLLFGLFLSMYLLTVLENLLIILAISPDFHLHTPVYFFLSNLSLTDIGFISTMVPKLLVNIQTHKEVVSYVGCLMQMSLFAIFGCINYIILTLMAYDQCPSNTKAQNLTYISEFYLMELSEDPDLQPLLFGLFLCMYLVTVLGNLLIILAMLVNIHTHGRDISYVGCLTQMSVFTIFACMDYMLLSVMAYDRKGAVASMMYTVVTPMLNPFIYSLRNRDIKGALRRLPSRMP
uniref:olfactory receptor 7E178-like n=1 Tax=Callospermophilus lateralis TaxID=76772 RepID=UPI004038B571